MKNFKTFKKSQKIIIILMIFLAIIFIPMSFVHDFLIKESSINEIERPKEFATSRKVNFKIRLRNNDIEDIIDYFGEIEGKKATQDEVKNYLSLALDVVEKNLFKEGEDFNNVITGININENVADNPSRIVWETNEEVFFENGEIDFDKVDDSKNIILTISAIIEEDIETREYELTIHPKKIMGIEDVKRKIENNIEASLKSDDNEIVKLPREIEGYEISYFNEKEELKGSVTSFFVMIIIGLFVLFNETNKRKEQRREDVLKETYPDFIGRFAILLGTGLSIIEIWKRLENSFVDNEIMRKEIKITLWEVSNGKTEKEAYENFSRRVGGNQYTKFISILIQSIKLGSSQILVRLESEIENALSERKNSVKTKGEIANTKLLAPMMLQLLLIMSIIMLPALISI